MTYRVTAPLVLARDKEGKVHERYESSVIDWLDDDQKRHFLEAKLVEEIGGTPADDPNDSGDKPAKTANKADLVEWIVANVAKDDGADYTAEELDGQTKPQLWELIDSVE